MIVKQTEQTRCETCDAEITIREYEGLEGAWYTDHICPRQTLVEQVEQVLKAGESK